MRAGAADEVVLGATCVSGRGAVGRLAWSSREEAGSTVKPSIATVCSVFIITAGLVFHEPDSARCVFTSRMRTTLTVATPRATPAMAQIDPKGSDRRLR